jgi:plasmid stabilization system protein ParE
VRVVWTPGAQEDARSIVLSLAEQDQARAARVAEAFALAAERISDFPKIGLSAGGRYRHLLISGGAYRVINSLEEDAIRILGIGRGASPWTSFRT